MAIKSMRSYIRVGAAIPNVQVADCIYNVGRIKELIAEAEAQGVEVLCFPELCITGYTCGDLFLQDTLLREAQEAIMDLADYSQDTPVCFIVGAPVLHNSKIYNCAVVCSQGEIKGIVPKQYLPNYSEFYEKRWFESYNTDEVVEKDWGDEMELIPFGRNILFGSEDKRFAVEICEDLWSVIPPSSYHSQAGAHVLFNLSASNELAGKQAYVKSLLSQQSARCQSAYVYASAGFGESTTDVVYSGNAYIYENGKLLAEAERFRLNEQLIISEIDIELLQSERRKNTTFAAGINPKYEEVLLELDSEVESLTRSVDPMPFIPADKETYREILSIQSLGLIKRIVHTKAQSIVLGVSGGLDSTLALLVCVEAVDKLKLPRETICGLTMPGFGTSGRTYTNAVSLMKRLGIQIREIDIKASCEQHFRDIGHDVDCHDVVFENAQARERTQILMDIANQQSGLVIGTGDMSELALGWATYNGDHISMYSVNSGVPKTLVRYLVRWIADKQSDEEVKKILDDILDTPVSPELLPLTEEGAIKQLTEEAVGPYVLHDFFLFYVLRYGFSPAKIFFLARQAFGSVYDDSVILRWMREFYRRFFSQQFKRSCSPDGPKVGSVNLSPRGDWRMPSDAGSALWLKEIDELITNNR